MQPRERLTNNITTLCTEALSKYKLLPSTASSLMGKMAFAGIATFDNILRSAIRPLVQRIYFGGPPRTLSHTLERAMTCILFVITKDLRRGIDLCRPCKTAIIIASDAQADPVTQPAAGAILRSARERTIAIYTCFVRNCPQCGSTLRLFGGRVGTR